MTGTVQQTAGTASNPVASTAGVADQPFPFCPARPPADGATLLHLLVPAAALFLLWKGGRAWRRRRTAHRRG